MPKRPCVFSTAFIRETVDPVVASVWEERLGTKAPFGKLRQMWKTQHCTKDDPYNTGCPYPMEDCALAFLIAVQRTAAAHPARPTGYFRTVALTLGLDRADNKPLARDIVRRTDVHKERDTSSLASGDRSRRPGNAEGAGTPGIHEAGDAPVVPSETGLRRADHRPVRIGELLGSINVRPHQGPPTDSQEGDQ